MAVRSKQNSLLFSLLFSTLTILPRPSFTMRQIPVNVVQDFLEKYADLDIGASMVVTKTMDGRATFHRHDASNRLVDKTSVLAENKHVICLIDDVANIPTPARKLETSKPHKAGGRKAASKKTATGASTRSSARVASNKVPLIKKETHVVRGKQIIFEEEEEEIDYALSQDIALLNPFGN